MRIYLSWEQQGEVRREEWWTDEHGYTRAHLPGLAEHIRFANFELGRAGLPKIERGPSGELYVEFDPFRVSGLPRNAGLSFAFSYAGEMIMREVSRHGFTYVRQQAL